MELITQLLNTIQQNSQTLRAIAADPFTDKYQKQMIEQRIALNDEAIKHVSKIVGKEAVNA